jgi:hypothetical protein
VLCDSGDAGWPAVLSHSASIRLRTSGNQSHTQLEDLCVSPVFFLRGFGSWLPRVGSAAARSGKYAKTTMSTHFKYRPMAASLANRIRRTIVDAGVIAALRLLFARQAKGKRIAFGKAWKRRNCVLEDKIVQKAAVDLEQLLIRLPHAQPTYSLFIGL